ncbi:MAG: hypothetical protein LC754_05100 [Acidobacteria bacterium]|nr:hypothetical protein [Acidobacteriota bacterium]
MKSNVVFRPTVVIGLGGTGFGADEWWPKNIPIGAIIAGAGQVRARGRLALFAKSEEIISSIRDAIREVDLIKSRKQMYKEDFLVSERGGVEVYIVGSVAGGTGSGMFLDTAFIARSFLDSRSNITGVLVLPGIFTGKAGVNLVNSNAYGALKELEHFSSLGLDNNFTIEYGVHHRVEAKQPPFDLTYLIDNTNEAGQGIRETAELQSIIAQGMYLQIGSQIGTDSANTVDNIKTHLSTAGRVRNRSANYCSYGVGTLTLPVRQFEAMEIDAARKLLSDGLLNGTFTDETLEAEVKRFIQDHHLREDESDEVIDALGTRDKGGLMRFPMSLGQITKYDNTAQSLIKQLHVTHRSRTEQQVVQRLDENYKKLLDESLRAVDAWWESALNRTNGSTYIIRFAEKLISKLDWYQRMMESEAKEESARLGALNFKMSEDQIQQAAGSLLGRARKIQAACENYKGVVDRECDLYVQKARRDKAADLYGALRVRVEELKLRCEEIRKKLKGALAQFEQEYLNVTATRGAESPFEHVLKFDADAHRPQLAPEEFVKWRNDNHGTLSAWTVVRDEDLAREILAFVKERYRPLTGLSIDEVLRRTDPGKVGQELSQLDHLSVPLWHYNDAKIPLNNRSIITELYHYGVADADDTALKDPKVATRVPHPTTELSFVSTQDPQRVMLFKVRVGVPLFALYGVEEMERAYNDPDKDISNHVHREWEKFSSVMPGADGEGLRWFAIAQAPAPVGLISRRGDWYYIRSQQAKRTDRGELRLGQGRINAYGEFEKNRELVKEVEAAVEAVTRTEGEAKINALLREYSDQLAVQVSGGSVDAAIKEQVEREIEEIEKYLKRMTTIR